MDKKLLKTNDAAKYLGVSRSSLTNWIRQGLISGGVTPGGHYRFSEEELDDFAKKRGLTVSPSSAHTGDSADSSLVSGASHSDASASAGSSDCRILLVDDDDAFREFVNDALEVFCGYELRFAEDGMQGAMLIGSWKPDLLILDVRMPNMNGEELLRLIRSNPELSSLKVMIASAHLTEELTANLRKLSPEIILEKPVHLAKLVASVQKLVDLELS